MPSRALKVLSVSDRIDSNLLERDTYERYKDIDLILSCGDLPYYHIEKLFQLYEVPVLYVRGNHDPRVEYGKSGPLYGPRGGIDLHNRVVVLNDLIFAGFEGSLPYKEGPFLHSQSEMWRNVLGMVPRLFWNKILYGRYLDVVLSHTPPRGIHDQETNVHGGYHAFRWLIKYFKQAYFFHGHIHVYTEDEIIETVVGRTKVINTYGHRKGLLRPGQRHYTLKEKPYIPSLADTAEDFRDARRRGALENIWSTLTGSANHLIQFQQVEEQLHYEHADKLGLVDIPLDAIVGSVSRPSDFTRKFFPRDAVDPGRWQRVKKVMDKAIRPIDVYQIDQAYFVLAFGVMIVITNLILIPIFGIVGAAIASCLSNFTFHVIRILFIYRRFKIQPFDYKILLVLLFAGLAYGLNLILPEIGNYILDILFRSIFITVIFGTLILVFNVSEEVNMQKTRGIKFLSNLTRRSQ